MLFDPAKWLVKFMQLTNMALDFRVFILVLGLGYLGLALTGEKYLLPRLAKFVGHAKQRVSGKGKQRKQYKILLDEMRAQT